MTVCMRQKKRRIKRVAAEARMDVGIGGNRTSVVPGKHAGVVQLGSSNDRQHKCRSRQQALAGMEQASNGPEASNVRACW